MKDQPAAASVSVGGIGSGAAAQSLRELFASRHSCRAYRSEPVPHDVIRQILEMARLAPSWCNTQPWQLIVTEGAETGRFADALTGYARAPDVLAAPDFAFPERYAGRYDVRRRECGLQLYASIGVGRGDRAAATRQMLENYRLFGAPHVAIVTSDRELGIYGAVDCGIFVSAFLLAARSFGVATTPQAALATFPAFVREYFHLSSDRVIVCGISFGYADENHPANGFRTTRAALKDIVDFRSE